MKAISVANSSKASTSSSRSTATPSPLPAMALSRASPASSGATLWLRHFFAAPKKRGSTFQATAPAKVAALASASQEPGQSRKLRRASAQQPSSERIRRSGCGPSR